VRVRRDKGASTTAITVRIASDAAESGEGSLARAMRQPGVMSGASEVLHTITVGKGDADAGIELAAARLRLALGDTQLAQLAEIRFRAGNARRHELEKTPYGQGLLVLSEALFPADHPLAGTVLGATMEGGALRDLLVAESMRREHALARASITIVGDVDEPRAKKLAEAFLASVSAPADAPVPAHPREDRLTVEEEVPTPLAITGWIGPAEGEPGDASLRVAVEMLENPKIGLLQRALVDRAKVAATVHADLEILPRASVATIEISPSHDAAAALRALDAELARLGDEGPDGASVAAAKFFVHARLRAEMAASIAPGVAGAVHSASLARLRRAIQPGAGARLERALDDVTVASVRTAIKHVLAKDHRVVVTTVPKPR
jgi:predicted Zn-dependent peptidase